MISDSLFNSVFEIEDLHLEHLDMENARDVETLFETILDNIDLTSNLSEVTIFGKSIQLGPSEKAGIKEYKRLHQEASEHLKNKGGLYIADIKDDIQPIVIEMAREGFKDLTKGDVEGFKRTIDKHSMNFKQVFIDINTKIEWKHFPEGIFLAVMMLVSIKIVETFIFHLLRYFFFAVGITSPAVIGFITLVFVGFVTHGLITSKTRAIAIKRGREAELTFAYNIFFLLYIFSPGTTWYARILKFASLWVNSIAATIQVISQRHDDARAGFFISVTLHAIIHILANIGSIKSYYAAKVGAFENPRATHTATPGTGMNIKYPNAIDTTATST